MNRFPHEVDAVSKRLCVQVGSAWLRCSARKLHTGYPKSQSYYLHQEAYQHGTWRANGSPCIQKYGASLFSRYNEAPVNCSEPNVYQLWQRFYKRPSGFSHDWSGERRLFCGWLPEKPVQFSKFWREPHWAKAKWHVQIELGLYPKFRERTVYIKYMTFFQELECDTGDNSVSLTPSEWANGYT